MQLAIKTHLLERFLRHYHIKSFEKGGPPCTALEQRALGLSGRQPGHSIPRTASGIARSPTYSRVEQHALESYHIFTRQRESNPMSPARQAIRLATVLLVAQRLIFFNS
ncbi:hypothetical protein T02_2793 [Trichinella nativa]|uniref:Uncharacterized protein n=1 Tax=Trichinella nativa TaxID=6335 RepID=A0A0V1LVH1_9BILA|nr:hypothetical protein T02_2793 [Trichinella nativa]